MGVRLNLDALEDSGFAAMRLERVFAECFAAELHTRLQGGANEPLYQPAAEKGDMHVLYYREDYFASALHEVAHWCIAGAQRRQHTDFGYWYAPDGRSPAQQRAFESVECKPQALEWFFSQACGYRFRVSVDNLEAHKASMSDTASFARRVLAQARRRQREGLPQRASIFYRALCREFGTATAPGDLIFSLNGLD